MTWPVYSKLLASAPSLSDPIAVGGPPPGKVWVVRWGAITWGVNVAYTPAAGIALSPNGPWSFVFQAQANNLGLYSGGSEAAFLHYVVADGGTLYARASQGTTVDLVLHGYELTAAGN